jgi:hypothetical protein
MRQSFLELRPEQIIGHRHPNPLLIAKLFSRASATSKIKHFGRQLARESLQL